MQTWSFGAFEVNEALFRLLRDGSPVPLEPRAFDVLRYLIRHRDRVVARAELLRELWPDVVVRGTVVGRLISGLRSALGDDARRPRYIETLRGRGFHFVHPVRRALAVAANARSGSDGDGDALLPVPLPPLPRIFVGQEREMRQLLGRLCRSEPHAVRAHAVVAVYGWPGVGKSTLAARLLSDPSVASRFDGGTLWCHLGPEQELRSQLDAWCLALGLVGIRRAHLGVSELAGLLQRRLRGRRMLIAVDDLWDARQLAPLRLGGPGSALLVTTRLRSVADAIASEDEVQRLDVLDPRNALELLRQLVPGIVESHPGECGDLVRALEGLPLALHVAASLLKAELRRGFKVAECLRRLGADCAPILAAELPADVEGPLDTVDARIGRSSAELTARTRDRFASLGRLERTSAGFDHRAFELAWGAEDVHGTLVELVERGLLEPARTNRYAMHALVHAHASALERHAIRVD